MSPFFAWIAAILISVASASASQPDGPVLFIGDSHSVQGFGKELDQLLREEFADQVFTRARWGSSPHGWLDASYRSPRFFDRDPGVKGERRKAPKQVPKLSELLTEIRPRLVVIALGTNLYGMLEVDRDFVRESVARTVGVVRAAGSACVWIGPAKGRKIPRAGELHDLISAGIGEDCLLIDSIEKTTYPRILGDGLHYDVYSVFGMRTARKWARKAFLEMRGALAECSRNHQPWCGTQ